MRIHGFRPLKHGLFAAILLLAGAQAHAQATRTWVSGVGNDANPCSRTAPCKTFAGAIGQTAPGGEIDVLDPGGFGALTITQAVTIDGGAGQVASVLVSGTNGIVVQAGASDVVRLRNLSIQGINGTGAGGINGIRFLTGGALEVTNVTIMGFTNLGIDSENSGMANLSITDTTLQNNAGGGILISGAGTTFATITRTMMYGGAKGLRVEDGSTVVVRDSTASGNSGNGFIASGTSRSVFLTLENCVAFNNAAAGVFGGNLSLVYISRCAVTGNGTGLMASGGQVVSAGNNAVHDNTTNGAPTSTPGQI